MSQIAKKLLIVCLIIWLPIASSIAATMDGHASPMQSGAASFGADDDHAANSLLPCHAVADSVTAEDDSACSHCALCHMANSVIPSNTASSAALALTDCPPVYGVVNFISFIPPLLQRPPSFSGI